MPVGTSNESNKCNYRSGTRVWSMNPDNFHKSPKLTLLIFSEICPHIAMERYGGVEVHCSAVKLSVLDNSDRSASCPGRFDPIYRKIPVSIGQETTKGLSCTSK
jgi:hypothetical protein